MSEKYLEMVWGDPNKADAVEAQGNGQGEATIIEDDHDTGDDPGIGEL